MIMIIMHITFLEVFEKNDHISLNDNKHAGMITDF